MPTNHDETLLQRYEREAATDERLEANAKARETNTEIVSRLMNFGPGGALQQVIIIEAIHRYAQQVAEAPPMEGGPINGEAYKRAATYIYNELETHLG